MKHLYLHEAQFLSLQISSQSEILTIKNISKKYFKKKHKKKNMIDFANESEHEAI